jgi:4-hydroxybenzoate polyprenyltransferase
MTSALTTLRDRLDAYEKLVRLDKPIGILLLLWPTLWALWISGRGHPNWLVVWLFVLGTVLMRSSGCAVNDFADRRFDAEVKRTRERPLARGAIHPWEALAVAAVLALAAFGIVLQFNDRTVWLSFAALAIAVIYPFLKRFFWMPQAWLGVAFGFGIPWPSPRNWTPCRRLHGRCSAPTSCGRSPTTPNMRWWIATTTCASASARPPSCSDGTMWRR